MLNKAKPKPDFRSLRSCVLNVCNFASRLRCKLSFVKTRTFIITFYLIISTAIIISVALHTKYVQIVDGDGTKYVYTFRSNPVSILKQCNITLTSEDRYEFSGFSNQQGKINLHEAYTVKVSADNKTSDILIAQGTVSDVLKKAGVTLGTDDIVNESMDTPVSPGMKIAVNRVQYQNVTQTHTISHDTITQPSTLLKRGTQQVQSDGKDGVATTTMQLKYVDGVLVSQQVLNQSVISAPVSSQVLVGTASNTPVSQLSPPSWLTLSSRGSPDRYSKVIDGVATAYTGGSSTATGRSAKVGLVAVNPNKIPYGSRLYIMSSDGSFVYGYAIAADTGGFTSNGSGVDVDLYFSTSRECSNFGKRSVKIYVLQ